MRKHFLAGAAAAAGLIGASLVGGLAVPTAGAASGDCGSGNLCAWYDSNYNGSRYQFAGNNTSWHSWAIADDDSSWYNRGTSGLRVQVYKNTNYNSTTICLSMGQKVSGNSSANDEGSSNKWNGC